MLIKKVFIVEKRMLNYCECKVANLVMAGVIYRDEDLGKLWQAPPFMGKSDFDFLSMYVDGKLEEVTEDVAIAIGIAKPYWEFYSVHAKDPGMQPYGFKATAMPLC